MKDIRIMSAWETVENPFANINNLQYDAFDGYNGNFSKSFYYDSMLSRSFYYDSMLSRKSLRHLLHSSKYRSPIPSGKVLIVNVGPTSSCVYCSVLLRKKYRLSFSIGGNLYSSYISSDTSIISCLFEFRYSWTLLT